jgi:hypothetical protein
MFGLAAIPAILMFTGMLFQQESPHWLVAQGREGEAREVLRRFRNEGSWIAPVGARCCWAAPPGWRRG